LSFGLVFSQEEIAYDIQAQVDSSEKKINITQQISFQKIPQSLRDTLYFTDWSNAYSTTESPLAQRLVEEYDRSFFLSNKSKLGKTNIDSFKINGKKAQWKRLDGQLDIIQLIPNHPISEEDIIHVEIQYELELPDSKFTGYGYDEEGNVFLRYWYISLSPIYDNQWQNYSHLDLDDFSIQAASYNISLLAPSGYDVFSNLNILKQDNSHFQFSGRQIRDVAIYWTSKNKFQTFKTDDNSIFYSDIFKDLENHEVNRSKVQRVDAFVSEVFERKNDTPFLLPELIYKKNPFFGLNDLPKFLAPFNSTFLEEISFLKSYLQIYLGNNIAVDLRKDHWLIGGLQTYLIIKYIEKYYPDQKYLGSIGNYKLMKAYTLAEIDFNESFWMYYEFMARANLQQSDLLPKDELVKFNQKIASPYHVGVGIRYLEHYLGKETIDNSLKKLINQGPEKYDWIGFLKENSPKNIDWFENFYLKQRLPIDIKIKKVKKYNDSIEVDLTQYSKNNIPFIVSQIKNDTVISQQWIEKMGTATKVTLPNLDPDFIAVNPEIRLPESNKMNNWKSVNNFLNLKPIHFNFLRDYESPKRNQIYYNPVVNYNLYDGLSLGSRFYDKSLLTQKFTFELMPQYSSLQQNLVGKVMMSYLIFSDDKSNYATTVNFFGSSYHYMEKQRYQVLAPGINFFFRTNNFRSNKQYRIGLYYYYVNRESLQESVSNPNYELMNLRYTYSNKGALKHTTFDTSIQRSDKFSKLEMTFDFRRLMSNGSQFSARVFVGKFLNHKQRETTFFDFNLNRPQDYLFRYNYFGRSESTGFFSQQFVVAEGGFKSKLFPATANDYLLTNNLTMGIWKRIEAYLDLGLLKNFGQNAHFLYGSGIRLNLVPDYLEIFLPVHSTAGWEFDGQPYETKIRFILTVSPKKLMNLFSRRWF